jgi:hypothetical protein
MPLIPDPTRTWHNPAEHLARLKRLAERHERDAETYERIGYGFLADRARQCATRVARQIEQLEQRPTVTGE